jgi:hypothetical protein
MRRSARPRRGSLRSRDFRHRLDCDGFMRCASIVLLATASPGTNQVAPTGPVPRSRLFEALDLTRHPTGGAAGSAPSSTCAAAPSDPTWGCAMANCTKCGAELIGSAKFCASCGAPAAQVSSPQEPEGPGTIGGLSAVARMSPAASASNMASARDVDEPVNPFAATAPPNANPLQAAPYLPPATTPAEGASAVQAASSVAQTASSIAHPAESGETARSPSRLPSADGSHVSPLAVSNALSQRGAFQQAIESAKDKAAASGSPPAKKPGTQLMQNAPSRPLPIPGDAPTAGAPGGAPEPVKKAPPRTVAMSFTGKPPLGGAGTAPQSVGPGMPPAALAPTQPPNLAQPAATPLSAVQPSGIQPSGIQPSMQPGGVQPSGLQPPMQPMQPGGVHVPPQAAPYAAYPQQHAPYPQPPAGPGGWGWAPSGPAMQPPPAPFQYPFGYVPGSRVQVTWSNGQRYPATVSQVSGSQCLVVFPDGQQHWVEMQYLAPS